jgi:tetratricopeptide (TPR) repeat protein
MTARLALLLTVFLAACTPEPATPPTAEAPVVVAQAPAAAPAVVSAGPHRFDTLGALHRPISSTNADAQAWFDQGLRMAYGFNHQAAGQAFAEAVKADPECAICWWGQALVLGPNINVPMVPEAAAPAWDAAQKALALRDKASPVEQMLIDAVVARYAQTAPEDRVPLDRAYADAMKAAVEKFPDDADVQVMYAESLMDLMPWAYWTANGQASPETPALLAALEKAIALNPDHIGAIHYYIHATEASPDPKRAEPHADRLAALAPGAGHLVHMPAHTYLRLGRYHDAVLINLKATDADATFLSFCKGSNGVYPLGYVPHNWHFIVAAAGYEGNAAMTLRAAQQTAQRADMTMLETLTMMQQFIVAPLMAQARFGRWDEILAAQSPPAALPYPTAIWHFVRGRAFAAKGDLEAARKELAAYEVAAADPRNEGNLLWGINYAPAVLKVGGPFLAGEIAAAAGDHAAAIASLTEAVAAEDALNYNEPADWLLPTRHSLGVALLSAGKAKEAEQVYRKDLELHPDNGWALIGLAQALEAQGKSAEAADAKARFDKAWANSDLKIEASRI